MDSAYRYGGEEFTILLPETTGKEAITVAERIRKLTEVEKMNPKGETFLFVVPSYLGHAAVNNSKKESGVLIEYASGFQKDVERCEIL